MSPVTSGTLESQGTIQRTEKACPEQQDQEEDTLDIMMDGKTLRVLEGYVSSSSAPPTPKRSFPMEHVQREVQPSIPLGRAWSKFVSVTTMAIHFLGSPYGISSHSPFMANWPYPSPVANMATSSSHGPFMAICVLGPSWPFTSIQHP
ncbi:hypothetical protein O181_125826 [Austropuccinia psidii MF-1]|uniref:Uncharacterized protein n=1 Tax=Austropuccinia psidii MF-1 TaxID=1389203 RepID=A0A9Q3KT63_9BASI|nr:hypothetical protein [Austropuccinia psidii MF-1]